MESKKRVLVFVPEFPVLTETFIERELSKLVERGNVDVVVFSIKKGGGEVSENLKEKVFYERMRRSDIFGAWVYLLAHHRKIKEALGILENSGNHLSKSFFYMLKVAGYSMKFSKCKPDLILAHFLSSSSTLTMLISKVLDVPFGISAHARDVTVDAEYVDEKVKESKFITVCNRNAYENLISKVKNIFTDKVKLLYHGVDPETIIRRSSEEKIEKPFRPLIFSVGRLVDKKGFVYLIEASKILKDRGIDHEVNIVGKGPLYVDLLEKIKSLGLSDSVKILGDNNGLSNKEVLSYLRICDIFAFPSIQTSEGDVDGVANVLLEAGVFKIPVVATDSGSTKEVIIDNETGLLCVQRDSEMMADCIERLLKDKKLSENLGEGLNKKVLDDFDLDKRIVDLESLLIEDY